MCGAHTAGEVSVLERDREAVQGRDGGAPDEALVGARGGGECALGIEGDEGVDGRIDLFDAVQMSLDDLPGGEVAAPQPGGEVGGVELVKRVGHEDLGRVQGGEGGGGGERGAFCHVPSPDSAAPPGWSSGSGSSLTTVPSATDSEPEPH